MNTKLETAYQNEVAQARAAVIDQDWDIAFKHLERAHILGQRSFFAHLAIHMLMFYVGWNRKDIRETFGQIMRMLAVFPANLFGILPKGNTGGANVSATKPMPIPEDLQLYFEP